MIPVAEIFQELLVKVVSGAREGITIADARQKDFPLVYVNEGFERLTGYSAEEAIAGNYRILQGTDTGQPEIAVMLSAMANGERCSVTLRNYRKDGSMFWNELGIFPMHDTQGELTHFIGVMKDMSDRDRSELQLETPAYTDSLIGISNRRHFDERFAALLQAARRIHSRISVLIIDLDNFKRFNERYGQSAGDECLRRVGVCIAKSFIRTTDCVARYGGEEFVVVSFSTDADALRKHAQKLCERVRALGIPHGDSPNGVVTISIGGIHRLPDRDTTEELLIEIAEQQLLAAKHSGRDCVHIID